MMSVFQARNYPCTTSNKNRVIIDYYEVLFKQAGFQKRRKEYGPPASLTGNEDAKGLAAVEET